ncbi:hypothetical protein DRN74_02555 [Candidatus Micrarchaeota archaeon]|nr:MAG: hypothetical protein DRN74_02555 [Candidatus Micrarchaeota archaeon]
MAFLTEIISKYEEEARRKIEEAKEYNKRNRPDESIFFESPRRKAARYETGKSYSPHGTGGGTDGIFLNSPVPACDTQSQASTVSRLERKLSNKQGILAIAEEAMYVSEQIKKDMESQAEQPVAENRLATGNKGLIERIRFLEQENERLRAELERIKNNQ